MKCVASVLQSGWFVVKLILFVRSLRNILEELGSLREKLKDYGYVFLSVVVVDFSSGVIYMSVPEEVNKGPLLKSF